MSECVHEWVNVRQYCEVLWVKALYKCSPFKIYHLPLGHLALSCHFTLNGLLLRGCANQKKDHIVRCNSMASCAMFALIVPLS